MIIKAEYFDIPGFILFIILFISGLLLLDFQKVIAIIVISISILGLLADGYSIITNFVLKNGANNKVKHKKNSKRA